MPLSSATIEVIKATAPVVGAHATVITSDFYKRMFKNNPEVLAFFNKGNQGKGAQPEALARAVVAYATHIEDLTPVLPALPRIIHKHCALGVEGKHYPIVAKNLMESVGHVLGSAVTEEVASAWSEAVGHLAEVLIEEEKKQYDSMASRPNGWKLFSPFKILGKKNVAPNVIEFTLVPEGREVTSEGFGFTPGQYLTVKVPQPPAPEEPIAPRHYTLTSRPGEQYLQIHVKALPGGVVSNILHGLSEGTIVDCSAPCGTDIKPPAEGKRVVFFSAGIGITPMLALNKHQSPLSWVHVDRSADALGGFEPVLSEANARVILTDTSSTPSSSEIISGIEIADDITYVICGPQGFMTATVAALEAAGAKSISYENFGPRSA